MTTRPLILIANDDGIYAPGIKHLWKAVHQIADVVVVAPNVEQSATSLSITIRHPLRLEKIEWSCPHTEAWAVNGTPADCIKLALNVVLPTPPSLILSGINRGSNAGRNVLYSGTAAAVMEGAMHHIPGIAFSVTDYLNPSYTEVEHLVTLIVNYALKHPLPIGTFLNVNFPSKEHGPIKGMRLTHQGKEYWAEDPEQRHHPFEGSPYYWLGGKIASFEEEEDCDIEWLKKGYASIVPLNITNLTNQAHILEEKNAFDYYVKANSDF